MIRKADGVTALGGSSLAKYYEYSTDKPGPFLNGTLAAGSSDGLYRVDLWSETSAIATNPTT